MKSMKLHLLSKLTSYTKFFLFRRLENVYFWWIWNRESITHPIYCTAVSLCGKYFRLTPVIIFVSILFIKYCTWINISFLQYISQCKYIDNNFFFKEITFGNCEKAKIATYYISKNITNFIILCLPSKQYISNVGISNIKTQVKAFML